MIFSIKNIGWIVANSSNENSQCFAVHFLYIKYSPCFTFDKWLCNLKKKKKGFIDIKVQVIYLSFLPCVKYSGTKKNNVLLPVVFLKNKQLYVTHDSDFPATVWQCMGPVVEIFALIFVYSRSK